jgi:hypothetical protein
VSWLLSLSRVVIGGKYLRYGFLLSQLYLLMPSLLHVDGQIDLE